MGVLRAVLAIVSLASKGATADPIVIDHTPAACFLASKFSVLEARLEASGAVKGIRVYFRASGTPYWSYVEMTATPGGFQATLPKPPKAAKEVYYYLEATDGALASTRTADYLSDIVERPALCGDPQRVARVVESASPVVGRGDAVRQVHSVSRGSSGTWFGIGALGAGAATAAVILAGHSPSAPAPTSLNGTYVGTLQGYTQMSQDACGWEITVAQGGSITVTIANNSANVQFFFPQATETLANDFSSSPCAPLAPVPVQAVTIPNVPVQGGTFVGGVFSILQTFSVQGTIANGAISGAISISGGPPGGSWPDGFANFQASKPVP